MRLDQLETAIAKLPPGELAAFAEWFQGYLAAAWDQKIEADSLSVQHFAMPSF